MQNLKWNKKEKWTWKLDMSSLGYVHYMDHIYLLGVCAFFFFPLFEMGIPCSVPGLNPSFVLKDQS